MNKATSLFYFGKRHPRLRPIVGALMRMMFSCDIAMNTTVGDGCSFEHNALGIVISSDAEMGDHCKIYHGVTIGAGKGGYPTLGNNITVFPNATIVGGIRIGDNAIVGANSFVNKDVPANVVVGGVPAVIIKEMKK